MSPAYAPDHGDRTHVDHPAHPHDAPRGDARLRVEALESLLTETGRVDPAAERD